MIKNIRNAINKLTHAALSFIGPLLSIFCIFISFITNHLDCSVWYRNLGLKDRRMKSALRNDRSESCSFGLLVPKGSFNIQSRNLSIKCGVRHNTPHCQSIILINY